MLNKRTRRLLDNIFGTVFIFALMGLIFGVAQFKVFDMFDPIGQALDDMELTDVVYSQLREDPLPDSNIVIVNLGLLPRGLIGKQIEIISKYNPKVIGMDSFFVDEHLDDPEGDSILSHAIANAKNFVMVTKLLQSDSLYYVAEGEELYDSLERSHPKFRQNAYEAYANLETEAASQEDFKACRNVPPFRKMLSGETQVAFAVKMAELYDKEKAEKYLARNNDWEVINYQGNVFDYFATTDYRNYFYVLDWMDVLDENFVPGMIKDKIVIFGYHGKNLFDTSWDDKFFTPLNRKFAGKANPDMYGVAVHANIVSNILREDYVETLSEEKGIVLAVLICFLNVMLFSMIYRRLPRWYDGLTKLAQVIEILILMFLMVMIFHWFDLKVNLTYTIAAVALAGDSLEVYYGVIKNLFNKESRRQLFTIDRK